MINFLSVEKLICHLRLMDAFVFLVPFVVVAVFFRVVIAAVYYFFEFTDFNGEETKEILTVSSRLVASYGSSCFATSSGRLAASSSCFETSCCRFAATHRCFLGRCAFRRFVSLILF